MNSDKRQFMLPDHSQTWLTSPYGVVLGPEFTTYEESLVAVLARGYIDSAAEEGKSVTDADAKKWVQENVTDPMRQNKHDAAIFGKPKVGDSSLGGSDVLNPLPAFNVDDDIIPDMLKPPGTSNYVGMGQVYNEVYDANQRVLYMTFGVPQFIGLEQYLLNAYDYKLKNSMDLGFFGSAGIHLGRLIANGLDVAIKLPWYPIIWTVQLLQKTQQFTVTEYVRFYQSMPMYNVMVNTIIQHLAVTMGLAGNGEGDGKTTTYKSTPEIFKNGIDIFSILNKRQRRLDPNGFWSKQNNDDLVAAQQKDTDKADGPVFKTSDHNKETGEVTQTFGSTVQQDNDTSSYWDLLTGAIVGSALGGNDFIGFRIEKSVDASESFSNTTKESSLAAELNASVQQRRDTSFKTANGTGFVGGISNAVSVVQNFFKAASGGLASAGLHMVTSNGYYDLPEQWDNSSFNSSHSFTVTLRAPYGDPLSIMQSIYIPLSCLLAGVMPRQVGPHTYTSPFHVRAYVKGMFMVPFGIIDQLTLIRGAEEFGWNHFDQPTVCKVTFSIKDLTPVLYLGMRVSTDPTSAAVQNTNFDNYIATLAGLGLKERLFFMESLKRKFSIFMQLTKSTYLNGAAQGTFLGNSIIGKALAIPFPVAFARTNSEGN